MSRHGLVQGTTADAIDAKAGRFLQRKCACGNHTGGNKCEECARKNASLRRKSSNENVLGEVPQIVHDVLRSPGQSLDTQTRAFMEPRFGRDFSSVRVHTTAKAAESSAAMNALAYTVGPNIVFAHQQYQPATSSGRRLLAHELTHTVQQGGQAAAIQGRLLVGASGDAYEREADQISDRVTFGDTSNIGSLSVMPVSRLQRKCVGGTWEYDLDGCTRPHWLAPVIDPFFDKDNPAGGRNTQFAFQIESKKGGRACDRHDECYQTCDPNLAAKQRCDDEMGTNMAITCVRGAENQEELNDCFKWAVAYLAILDTIGEHFFWEQQAEVCECDRIRSEQSRPKGPPKKNENEQKDKLKKAEPPGKAKENSPTKTLKMPINT